MEKMLEHFPHASAYMNEKFILILTRYGCPLGGYDYDSPIHLFSSDIKNDEYLGQALLTAIQSSRQVPLKGFSEIYSAMADKQYDNFFSDIMKKFEYKTKHALFKKMRLVFIDGIDGNIKLSPSRHVKLQAWEGLDDESKSIIFPYSTSATEAGAALRLAFERCK